jgi:hypothetical protein
MESRVGSSAQDQLTVAASTVVGYVKGSPSRADDCAVFRKLLREGYGITDESVVWEWVAVVKRVAEDPGPRPVDEVVPYPGLP